mmetsp:Transcript_68/g.128  ORF Transcript_68/g.128 Transcript_68/m.128 type:complete len:266 (-) Transcript_68:1109-1906(-)
MIQYGPPINYIATKASSRASAVFPISDSHVLDSFRILCIHCICPSTPRRRRQRQTHRWPQFLNTRHIHRTTFVNVIGAFRRDPPRQVSSVRFETGRALAILKCGQPSRALFGIAGTVSAARRRRRRQHGRPDNGGALQNFRLAQKDFLLPRVVLQIVAQIFPPRRQDAIGHGIVFGQDAGHSAQPVIGHLRSFRIAGARTGHHHHLDVMKGRMQQYLDEGQGALGAEGGTFGHALPRADANHHGIGPTPLEGPVQVGGFGGVADD